MGKLQVNRWNGAFFEQADFSKTALSFTIVVGGLDYEFYYK